MSQELFQVEAAQRHQGVYFVAKPPAQKVPTHAVVAFQVPYYLLYRVVRRFRRFLQPALASRVTLGMKILHSSPACLALPLYPLPQYASLGCLPVVISSTCPRALSSVGAALRHPLYVLAPTMKFPRCVEAMDVLQPNSYFFDALPLAMQAVSGSA